MRKVTAFLLILPVLLLTACGKKTVDSPLYSKTPEDAIQRAFDLCRAGKYQEAARLYVNGPQVYKNDPGLAKSVIDKACTHNGKMAIRYEVYDKAQRGEGAVYTLNLSQFPKGDPPTKYELWYWQVTLIKKSQGWIIAEGV